MSKHWQGPINGLLYGLIFAPDITGELVDDAAEAAINYTLLGEGPEVYYEAIQNALASGERLDRLGQLSQFDHTQIEGFLRAVAARLDVLRPWPEPEFRRLPATAWETFGNAVPIARLKASIVRVRRILRGVFEPAGDAWPGRYVLMLTLATGETVALLGAHGPGERITLMTNPGADPAEVIEHFTAATGFPPAQVERIHPTP